jgi:hypothetical protein
MNNNLYAIFGSILLIVGVLLLIFPIVSLDEQVYQGRTWMGAWGVLVGGAGMLFRYYNNR